SRSADSDAARRDQEELVVEPDHEGGDHVATPGGELDPLDAHGAAALAGEALELGALAVAGIGDDEDVDIVAGHVTGHDLVGGSKAHADDAGGRPPHGPDRVLAEADGLAVAADH